MPIANGIANSPSFGLGGAPNGFVIVGSGVLSGRATQPAIFAISGHGAVAGIPASFAEFAIAGAGAVSAKGNTPARFAAAGAATVVAHARQTAEFSITGAADFVPLASGNGGTFTIAGAGNLQGIAASFATFVIAGSAILGMIGDSNSSFAAAGAGTVAAKGNTPAHFAVAGAASVAGHGTNPSHFAISGAAAVDARAKSGNEFAIAGSASLAMSLQRPWLPADFGSGLKHWYDLQDTATITDVGSGVISALGDKSGNAYNLTAAAGKRGTLTYANSNFGGYNTLNFGSTGMGMIAGSAGFADIKAWLLDVDTTSAAQSVLNICGAVMTTHFAIPENYVLASRHSTTQPASGDNLHRVNGAEAAHPDGTVTPTGACSYFFAGRVVDSGQSTVGRFTDVAGGSFCLGNRMSDYARTATGTHFAELLIVTGYLSDSDMALFEGYLAWKYGLQGSLPSGHTYKNARPMVAP